MRKIFIFTFVSLSVLGLAAFFGDKPALIPAKANEFWVEMAPEQKQAALIFIPSLAPLVNRVKPAVLVVTTESLVKYQDQIPEGFEDFFRFFGPNRPMPQQKRKSQGLGSGFIIHPSGLALTNNHVIEGATKIKVKIGGDLKEYDAKVIGADPNTDVALLQIESPRKDWPTIPLGHSSVMQVGDFALAIGNPLGLDYSIAFGPISALGRRDIQPSGRAGLFDFMQISASINPGNSGGALLNMSGEVIGINTAISASGQGIAFSIPIDQVKLLIPQLKKNGKASRSGLGVSIGNVSPELAKELGLPYAYGALVREVLVDSPAAKAGLQPGDVIVEFDNKKLNDASALSVEAGLAGVGKKISVKILRDGAYFTAKIVLEAFKESSEASVTPTDSKDLKDLEEIGIRVKNYSSKTLQGVQIALLNPESLAAQAGLQVGDVITKLNNQPIKDTETLTKLVSKIPSGGILKILMKRKESTLFVVLPKP